MTAETEGLYKKGILLHAITFVPFLVAFGTNSWAAFDSPGGIKSTFGLWNVCHKNESHSSDEGHPIEVCDAHDIHDISGYFHATRTVYCMVLITYALGFFSKWSWTCDAQSKKTIRMNLCVQGPIYALLYMGMAFFFEAKDEFDEQNMVNSRIAFSVIAMWVVIGLCTVAAVLTTLPLTEKCTKKCRKKYKFCCCKTNTENRNNSSTAAATTTSTSTATSSTTAATTTTTTRSVATSTTSTDLSTVEVPRPPSYSLSANPDFNAWFELYVARSQSVSTNPGLNSNVAGQTQTGIDGDDQNSNSSRPSSRGIFTVRVNPAPVPPSSGHNEGSNFPTPYEREPSAPPPRYEDIITDSIPQPMLLFRAPSAPPPSYENTTSGDTTILDPAQLTVESRGTTAASPSQSDV